ncbi:MAG: alcohol dehydrogenase catalytic domain-containing protein [Thermoplasmatota archaeon]
MRKMKVAMYYNNHDVRIEKQDIPAISDNELLVKVIASGVCGSDVMEWYRLKKAPLVLGHEIAGIVEKTGKNVTKFKKGDRVFVTHHVPCNTCDFCKKDQQTLCHTLHSTKFYPGGFAQYIRVPEINIRFGTFKLPDNVSFDEGTFIEPLACAVRGFRVGEYRKGQSVLVLGSGMAGLLNIKLAKAYGAKKIFATDIDKYRLDLAKKIGADVVIHAKEDIVEQIKKNNNECLVDFVILCAGVSSAVKQAIDSVDYGGTILWFAMTPPGIEIPIPFFDLWNKQVKTISTYAGAGKDITEAIKLIETQKITTQDLISHKLPMNQTPKAFKLVAEAKQSMKVIVEPHQ